MTWLVEGRGQCSSHRGRTHCDVVGRSVGPPSAPLVVPRGGARRGRFLFVSSCASEGRRAARGEGDNVRGRRGEGTLLLDHDEENEDEVDEGRRAKGEGGGASKPEAEAEARALGKKRESTAASRRTSTDIAMVADEKPRPAGKISLGATFASSAFSACWAEVRAQLRAPIADLA